MTTETSGIVWVTLDSVRADHTTIHGYNRDTTPELERIADEGTAFKNCFSQGTGTASSVASILTGVWPGKHQVAMNENVGKIPAELRTATELLSEQGYRTACVTTNPRVELIGGDAGFDEYYNVSRSTLLEPENLTISLRFLRNLWSESVGLTPESVYHSFAYVVTEIAKKWLDSVDGKYFLYVHYNEPHRPFYPPLPLRSRYLDKEDVTGERAAEISRKIHERSLEYNAGELQMSESDWRAVEAMYDAEIAYTDKNVGRLYDSVNHSDSTFVVTADHGEMLGEQGLFSHGQGVVRDEVSHVPMIIRGLRGIETEDNAIIQHNDVMKTLLSRAGAPNDQFDGFDLCGDEEREFAVIQEYTEDYAPIENITTDFKREPRKLGRIDGLRSDEFKLVTSRHETDLYKLPDEETDTSDIHSTVKEILYDRLETWNEKHGQPVADDLSPDNYDESAKKRLRDLGYIQ